MAKLYFRYGAMNCGKSSLLMQVAYNYNEKGKNVILIKSTVDTKGDNYLVSRLGIKRKVDIFIDPSDSLEKYYDKFKNNISCILVDEAQFLSDNQIEELWYVSKMFDIPVICYGLKVDFTGHLFTGAKRLIELSDELEELVTICRCGNRAKFNARYVNGKIVSKGEVVVIDGSDDNVKYEPLCGKCYLEEIKNNM